MEIKQIKPTNCQQLNYLFSPRCKVKQLLRPKLVYFEFNEKKCWQNCLICLSQMKFKMLTQIVRTLVGKILSNEVISFRFWFQMNTQKIHQACSKAFKTLRLKIRDIQALWRTKCPAEKWNAIRDVGRMISNLIGIRIFSNLDNYWYTASCGVCAIIYFSLNFYTIQYYMRRSEFIKIIECTYLFGIVIAVCVTVLHIL